MACEYCHGEGWHDYRCPLYKTQKPLHYCSACGQGIQNGEDYIVNDDGDYRHFDCICGIRDLLEWLGYEVKTMEENDERNY